MQTFYDGLTCGLCGTEIPDTGDFPICDACESQVPAPTEAERQKHGDRCLAKWYRGAPCTCTR